MKSTLVITDVTRMWRDRVCVAGINEKGETIRPVLRDSHITESWLYDKGKVIIYPFSLVNFKLIDHQPDNPHSEDWVIDPSFKKQMDVLDTGKRKKYLDKLSDMDVVNIFGAEIHHNPGSYIREGEGNRSLGTIKADVIDFFYGIDFNRWDYRVRFKDDAGQEYNLRVTDLSFRYYCDYLRNKKGLPPQKISEDLREHLIANTTFLRIGLARPTWDKYPHSCFLQITGVYTFPDCLNGRCFADFS